MTTASCGPLPPSGRGRHDLAGPPYGHRPHRRGRPGLDCGIIVNVQGDEPLIEPAMIDEAIGPLVNDAAILMGTVCRRIDTAEEAFDPNVVKVVLDEKGFALLFSRAPIPWDRDAWAGKRSLDELP